jgi:hypothetical protein
MNKIVVQFGLLIFFLSIIFFVQQGIVLEHVIIRALVVFVVVTITLAIIILTFMKAVNKTVDKKDSDYNNMIGNNSNE